MKEEKKKSDIKDLIEFLKESRIALVINGQLHGLKQVQIITQTEKIVLYGTDHMYIDAKLIKDAITPLPLDNAK